MTDIVLMMKQLRAAMMDFAVTVPDGSAARYPNLFKSWKPGVPYAENDRREYGELLYKCRQAHTSQEGWEPDKSPALWVVINAEHEGSVEDPIPAAVGMEYVYGKHYKDPEDSKIYKCNRIGAADGETIILHYLPHALVGQYFDEVIA